MTLRSINPIVLVLLISDVILYTGLGLVEPILVLFLKDLDGASIFKIGLASSIFLLTKSLVQLPFSKTVDSKEAHFFDKHKHFSLPFIYIGIFTIAMVPFMYLFVENMHQVYLVEFIYGCASGIAYPAWMKMWESHMDKYHESYTWTLYSTLVGFVTAVSATIGAYMAEHLGFRTTFMVVGLITSIGALILLYLLNEQKSGRLVLRLNPNKKAKK